METVILINNLSKKYQLYNKPFDRVKEALSVSNRRYHEDFYALKDISLDLKRGETIGVIGKNGSGKSTLLKIISGVLSPTEGEVQVNGTLSALLELGTGFNMEYTGIENIYLNGMLRGITREEMDGLIDEILEFADIGDFINQPVKTYSSGMFARLAFSVVVSFKPEILIVDEALSVGDIFFQKKCNQFMKDKMANVTKFIVTHDMNTIANMADRVVVLDKGEIVFQGEPLKAIEFYTKLLHTETFRSGNSDAQEEIAVQKEVSFEEVEWHEASKESLGGALEVVIDKYSFTVNSTDYKGYVQPGDKVEIYAHLSSRLDAKNIIIGYLVNDKYGNAIFGENTVSSKCSNVVMNRGDEKIIKLSFMWPEIQPNDYFVTIGIGEGTHEMDHVVQCWAHNIINVKSITHRPIHALFNNKIMEFETIE